MADAGPPTWNLFRRKLGKVLYCAVPDGCALPSFVKSESWEFNQKVSDSRSLPRGFNPDLAYLTARLNGFYVFQVLPGEG